MATTVSSSVNIKMKELEDIAECCICTEVYTDPKALPCIHTFCMKCIQETGLKTNKGPGGEMPCPICRRLFKIPPEGFPGLPKNYFIERLIQVSKVSEQSAVSRTLCSVCLEETKEQEGKEIPTADTYCVDCKHKLCQECCSEHRKFKATKNHKLIPINELKSGQNLMGDLGKNVCELHEQNILNVYCADCKTVVCAICFIEEHNNHDGSHVNKCFDGFRKQIQNNTEAMNECNVKAEEKKAELVKAKEELQGRVESLEIEIETRKDKIKELTDKHATRLLQGLRSDRQSRLKEIQISTDDIDAYLSNLESYNCYCQKLLAKGSASDMCRAVSGLCVRAIELQQQWQPIVERRIRDFKFCFRQFELEEFLEEDFENLIGEIEEDGDWKKKTRSRSKQYLLAEQNNEIDLLRKKIEIERTEKESLWLANEQLRIDVAKEVQVNKTLTEERSNYDTRIARLKQELDDNNIANNTLQANNDKLKQELDAAKTNSISLQTSYDKLVEKLNMHKATVKTFDINAEKLRRELETTKREEFRYKWDPVLVQMIRTIASETKQTDIYGLTILDKELFVVKDVSSEVEVYDSIKFTFSRRWNLKETFHPSDIGSCNRNKCLYSFDFKRFTVGSNKILRVDTNGKLIMKWSTGDDIGRLCVTYASNVILIVGNKNKLNEYSSDGQLIRETVLSPSADLHNSWHAIKLTSGHFVVSLGLYGDDLHGVSVIDADGERKKSFGEKLGSTIGQMNGPLHFSIDGNGFVMVADRGNSRVLLLDSDLKPRREILSKEKHGLRLPSRIFLDETNGHLFVADNDSNNQRILIFRF